MWTVRALVALTTIALAWTADAAVICKKKSGAVLIRDACKKKEEAVDLSAFGAIGPKGDKGDPGDPGPLLTTLPSGRTLRGAWGFGFSAPGASVAGEGPISYQFALETSPTVIIVQVGAPTPPGCTGDVANPGADPGNLCVFAAFKNGPCGDVFTYGASDGISDYRIGAMTYMHSTATGFCETSGTWAVTAP